MTVKTVYSVVVGCVCVLLCLSNISQKKSGEPRLVYETP